MTLPTLTPEQLEQARLHAPNHIYLDDQGEGGELDIDVRRDHVVMHSSRCVRVSHIRVKAYAGHATQIRDWERRDMLHVVAGLFWPLIVDLDEIRAVAKWPTHLVSPPRQNLSFELKHHVGTKVELALAALQIVVGWSLLTSTEEESYLAHRAPVAG